MRHRVKLSADVPKSSPYLQQIAWFINARDGMAERRPLPIPEEQNPALELILNSRVFFVEHMLPSSFASS